ncbi:MAG: RHS repeat-associated core domain-containing protein, partial [Kibdelosporangium sp.]
MRRRTPRHVLLACLTGAVIAPLMAVPSAAADPWTPAKPGDPAPLRTEKIVPGRTLAAQPLTPDRAAEGQLRGNPTVTWPAGGSADVDLSPAATVAKTSAAGEPMVRVGQMPVWLGKARSADATELAPTRVQVDVLEPAGAERAGVPGIALSVKRTDGKKVTGPLPVQLDYSAFRDAYGGDWAARLRIVQLPACAAATPDRPECRTQNPLRSKNDTKNNTVTAQGTAGAEAAVFALAAGDSGATGDFSATPLADAAKWQVSAQAGSFSWSYPLRTPPVPGGLSPSLGLAYGSGSVDGRTASTNNQPTWAGEGWDLWSGQITWRFKQCSQDTANGSPQTGDQCWAGDHASMVFNGRASELVRVGDSDVWRPTSDDGTRFEQLAGVGNGDHGGQYWKATTTDGTQYFFGLKPESNSTWTLPVYGNDPNEPCKAATFEASACNQAWRWNLDYVVDWRGNTMTYHYAKETNNYAQNLGRVTAQYVRGGTLKRIEYGTHRDVSGAAPAWVDFETAPRCVPNSDCAKTPAAQPDVPWDRNCDAAPCTNKITPTFWSTQRLAKITTKIRSAAGEQAVDSWTLEHIFPNPNDGTKAALWLQKITHTGLGGNAQAEPPTEFRGTTYANRINTPEDGQPPLNKYRMEAVYNPTGGITQIIWEQPDCKPGEARAAESNTKRCFPVRWSPEQGDAITDWFHKYVVRQVVQVDRVGGAPAQVKSYDYLGDAAWHYNDDPLIPADRRTWSDWRGYGKVAVRDGNPGADPTIVEGKTEYVFYRGMHGDRLNPGGGTKTPLVEDSQGGRVEDLAGLAGFVRETVVYDGVGKPVVTSTINTPWRKETASKGGRTAYFLRTERTDTRTAISGGGVRKSAVVNTHDDNGILTRVSDLGDTASGKTDDDRCTDYEYARNTSAWVLTLTSRVHTYGVACGGTASFPADSISDVRTFYDDGDLGVPPTTGTWIRSEQVVEYNAGIAVYKTDSRTQYDSYGRTTESYDALNRKTSTSYSPATGLTTEKTITNTLLHATKSTIDPRWGVTRSTVDVNQRRTDAEYDALGRLTEVWRPGRSKELGDGPHVRYRYTMRTDGASGVATDTLKANDNYVSSYTLLDGFLRPRQTQKPAWVLPGQQGRILTDTEYDSRGKVARTNGVYTGTGTAGTDLFKVDAATDVPTQTVLKYDGAGRTVSTALVSAGVEKSRSTTEYRGDATAVTPPPGGTATTNVVNARGQTVELRQHKQLNTDSAADTTKYTFTKSGEPKSLTDAANNTWTYEYDVRGRRISATDPDKGRSTMTYDDAGQMTTRTDARNQKVVFAYDNGGRTKSVRRDSEAGTILAEWQYDPTNAKGELASSTRYVAGTAYTFAVTGYDEAYNATSSEIRIPASADPVENKLAGTYASVATYRDDGTLVHEKLPRLGNLASEDVHYGFDDLGMANTLVGAETYVGHTRYTPFYETEMTRFGVESAELWEQQDYDRITRQMSQVRVQHRKSTEIQAEDTLTYDLSGNITKLTNTAPGSLKDAQCFGYDYLRRLTEAWTSTTDCAGAVGSSVGGPAPYWTTYGYDLIGNRQSELQHTTNTLRTTAYPAPGQPRPHSPVSTTTGSSTVSYGYNQIGATTSRPGPTGAQTLSWDEEGKLATAGASSYIYDAAGTRLITKDDKGATLHLASGEIRYDKASNIVSGVRTYVHNGTRVAVRTGTTKAGVSYVLQDHHGTDNLAVNADSLTVSRRRLDLFGQPRGTQPTGWPGSKGFVGGTIEAGTGLTHVGARSYDPATGKFLSVDPLLSAGEPQAFNAYAYANNNPVTFSDSTGLARDSGDNTDCPPGTSSCWAAPAPPPPAPPAPAPPAPAPRSSDNTRCPPGTSACSTGKPATKTTPSQQKKGVPWKDDRCSGPFKPWECYSAKEKEDFTCGPGYSSSIGAGRLFPGCKGYDQRRKDKEISDARENRKNQQLADQARQAEEAAKQASRKDSMMACSTINLVVVAFESCSGTDRHGGFNADSVKALPLALGATTGVKTAPGDRGNVAGQAYYLD